MSDSLKTCPKCKAEFAQPKTKGAKFTYCELCRKPYPKVVKYPNCINCDRKLAFKDKHHPFCSNMCRLDYELKLYRGRKQKTGCLLNDL